MAKGSARPRKRVKKNVVDGVAHVHASFNNTIVTITDMQGNESWLESGDVVAANPKVLAQMLQIIAPHIK